MPLRTLIDATDLSLWADRRDSQSQLPQLLRRLIHATVTSVRRIDFPAGEAVQLGGWDGIVSAEQGNAFVPDGVSGWELGVKRAVKGKADDDYEKRSANPLGLDTQVTAFIFVTPRRWGGKDKWIAERQAEGIWREVRAYDADDLEQWLELAPAVHIWLSIILGKHPETATELGTFWMDWSEITQPKLIPSLLTRGRDEEIRSIHAWLQREPSSLALKADSRKEAVAFLAAVVHALPIEEQLPLLARTVIVPDSAAWNHLVSSKSALLLIPTFDIGDSLSRAVRGGHHVLLPLGNNDSDSETTVVIPRLRRQHAREALLEMGMGEDQANELAVLARRNLLALRRHLARNPEVQQPAWAGPTTARELLPALLAGGWSDSQPGDQAVLARLARLPYEEVNTILVRWANEPDPPVYRVGNTWQLVSKEDAWLLLARFLTRDTLDPFEDVVNAVLGAIDPQFDLPTDQRWMAGVLGHIPAHSTLLRKSLADSLALMAARSSTTHLADAITGQERANRIVNRLLSKANDDWRVWASLASILQSLAEAAPDEFLAAVEAGLSGEMPVLKLLFQDSDNALFASSPHTGLLWALELLAWNPDYLGRAALLLAWLAALDPGGKLMNRPDNSLRDILLCLRPHTTATLSQRLDVLDLLRSRTPDIAWKLLCRLIPEPYSTTSSTALPRWREWVSDTQPRVTYVELAEAVQEIVARLVADVGTVGQRWQDLIKFIDDVPDVSREAIIEHLRSIDPASLSGEAQEAVREALRTLIARHRKFADSDWALPKAVIDQLQSILERFEPDNPIEKYGWLFSSTPPLLEEAGDDWQMNQQAISAARREAVNTVYAEGGVPLLLQMADSVERPDELGISLGMIGLLSDEEEPFLCQYLGADREPHAAFVVGYIRARSHAAGGEWVRATTDTVLHKLTSTEQARFFLCLPFESRWWDLLTGMGDEAERSYWSLAHPWTVVAADCKRAVTLFLKFNRAYEALHLISLHVSQPEAGLSPTLIAQVLEQAANTTPEPNANFQMLPYYLSELLDVLEMSSEIEEARIARLEWAFLPLLEYEKRGPKILHRELARNPDFFIELLTLAFRGENEEVRPLSAEDQLRAQLAWTLLHSWKLAPGMQADGTIDQAALNTWISEARAAAPVIGRAKICDLRIGEVLVHAPKDSDGSWPTAVVRDVIENLASEEIDRGFVAGVRNSRGIVSKVIGEGGGQERQLADKYHGYAQVAMARWPRTASVLRQIAEIYISEARGEDIRADLEEDL